MIKVSNLMLHASQAPLEESLPAAGAGYIPAAGGGNIPVAGGES